MLGRRSWCLFLLLRLLRLGRLLLLLLLLGRRVVIGARGRIGRLVVVVVVLLRRRLVLLLLGRRWVIVVVVARRPGRRTRGCARGRRRVIGLATHVIVIIIVVIISTIDRLDVIGRKDTFLLSLKVLASPPVVIKLVDNYKSLTGVQSQVSRSVRSIVVEHLDNLLAIMVIVILLISGGTSRGCRIVRRVLLLVVVTAGIVTVAGNEIDWRLTTLNSGRKLVGELVKERGGNYV